MSRVAFQRAFQELTDDEVERIMKDARHVEFEDGETIIREGDDLGRIMVVLEGSVRVVRLKQGEKEKELAEPLGPGDTLGEMSFIDGLGASATLIAKGHVKVRAVDHELVEEIVADSPGFRERLYHSVLFTVIQRLRQLDYKLGFST